MPLAAFRAVICCLAVTSCWLGGALAAQEATNEEPTLRVAEAKAAPSREALVAATADVRSTARLLSELEATNHPLLPVLKYGQEGLKRLDNEVRDYSCQLVKRERVGGVLGDYYYMYAKVRHEKQVNGKVVVPFSVYLRFLKPDGVKDREVLYVDGQNDGKLIARNGGKRFAYVTTELDPEGEMAMRDNRHPVTSFGFKTLVERLVEGTVQEIMSDTPCDVKFFRNAKVDDRVCTCIEVTSPEHTADARFHSVKLYIDNELQVPINYMAYEWPKKKGDEPVLVEQYTFRDIKLNVGFRDIDFDRKNPKYGFGD